MKDQLRKGSYKDFRRIMGLDKEDEVVALLTAAITAAITPGTPPETLESAGCDGNCPMYPGAPKDKMGLPDCSKCPQFNPNQ